MRYFSVSIPHRYAKNLPLSFLALYSFIVSIPHRYAKNGELPGIRKIPGREVSIPHRYAKNASMTAGCRSLFYGFNSS